MASPPTLDPRYAECDSARWFAEEVQPHEPALRAYLHRHFPAMPDVDDVVQESFLKAWLARRSGKLTAARGFLFHVARQAVATFYRKRKFLSAQPLQEIAEQPAIHGETDVVRDVCCRDEIELISDAIAALPERCGEIVMLRLLRGLRHDEIAAQLGVAEPTVRVQLARGLKKCTEFLRKRGARGMS